MIEAKLEDLASLSLLGLQSPRDQEPIPARLEIRDELRADVDRASTSSDPSWR
jgi:hypothetical protein